jgi:hypothetical protein
MGVKGTFHLLPTSDNTMHAHTHACIQYMYRYKSKKQGDQSRVTSRLSGVV